MPRSGVLDQADQRGLLHKDFRNRREVGSYVGLTPSPWKSGGIDRDQGISKAGNPRARCAAIELAWLWLRHQSDSKLTQEYRRRPLNAAAPKAGEPTQTSDRTLDSKGLIEGGQRARLRAVPTIYRGAKRRGARFALPTLRLPIRLFERHVDLAALFQPFRHW
jgi:Transposase IS116/IS110/IS902 family